VERTSILIVGGGIAGLTTAYHLTRAGATGVTLVERDTNLAQRASSKSAAILRTPIEEPTTAAMARRSKKSFLTPPEGFSPTPLLVKRGLVLMANHREAAADLERLCSHPENTLARLSPVQLAALCPHIATEPLVAFYAPDDGVLDIAALVAGFERGARGGGVRFELGTGVVRILTEGGRAVGVELADGRELRANRVVIAAGAWAAQLAQAAGSRVTLRPTRRHLLITEPDPSLDPDWPVVWNGGDAFYTRPADGGLMLSVCDEVDAPADTEVPLPQLAEAIAAGAARHLVGERSLTPARFWLGLRTLTADDRFAIGADPDVPGLHWAAGFGGHGMTCSFEAGRLAAAHLVGRGADEPLLGPLDPARLAVASPRTRERDRDPG